MTIATWAMGTQLLRGGIGGDACAKLTSIDGLNLDSDEAETTSFDSPGGYEEIIQTVRRSGEVSAEGFFVPSNVVQQQLYSDYTSGEILDWAIVFPESMGAAWIFQAFVKGIETGVEVNDGVPFNMTLRVTGQPELVLTNSAGISALTVEDGVGAITLSPTFANDEYLYIGEAASGAQDEVTFTVAAVDHAITVNGTTITHNVESDAFALGAAGSNTLFRIVVQEENQVPVAYDIYIIRPPL